MVTRFILLGLLAGLGAAAPVAEQMESNEKSLVRSKRVHEIIYTGEESVPGKRSSEPGVPLRISENQLDKKASVHSEVRPAVPEEEAPSPVEGQAGKESPIPVLGQTEALEKMMATDENDLEKLGDFEESNDQESSGEEEDFWKNIPKGQDDYSNYLYEDYYPWAEELRKKRSTPELSKPLTAENMMEKNALSTEVKSSRVKRDLTRDEIRELLQNAVEDDVGNVLQKRSSAERWELQEPEVGYETEEMPGWTKRELETLAEAEQLPAYGGEYIPTQAEEEVMAIEEAKARMALMRLLEEREEEEEEAYVEAEREQEAEAVAEALKLAYAAPYRTVDGREEEDVVYEPIIYQGVPGIFIPMRSDAEQQQERVSKRQYLSLVPGMRKRGSPWYPADTSARWDAMVPETKRSEQEYERLFRLAQELNKKKK